MVKKKKAGRKTKVNPNAKKSGGRKISGNKARAVVAKKKRSRVASKEPRSPEPSTLGRIFSVERRPSKTSAGSAAGQSGDLQGLSRRRVADSESVEELVEEGQAREAAAVSGVEDSLDPDQGEVQTREVPADDVPEEYDED
jgi:hypothetical protein